MVSIVDNKFHAVSTPTETQGTLQTQTGKKNVTEFADFVKKHIFKAIFIAGIAGASLSIGLVWGAGVSAPLFIDIGGRWFTEIVLSQAGKIVFIGLSMLPFFTTAAGIAGTKLLQDKA